MKKSLVSYLVRRYLRFDKSQPFISISAILAFLGVSIGIMVLIIAMAIMNGTAKEFKDKISTMSYPITILPVSVEHKLDRWDLKALEKKFPSYSFSPYINTQVIIKNGDFMEGGVIFGVDFDREKRVNKIIKEATKDKNISKKFEAILGKGLSFKLGLNEGEKATFIFTKMEPGGFSSLPVMKRFRYRGSFDSGMQAYDNAYVYTSIYSLTKVLRGEEGVFDGIHVISPNPHKDIEKLRAYLAPNYGAIGWWEQNKNLFSAMAMEKKALFIVLMLIILVASLNIISSLLMTVMNRRREIALLLSLGATRKEIKSSFFRLGFIIGGVGILFGIFLGLSGIYILGHFDIVTLPADVYGTSKLPLDLSTTDFISIVIGGFVIVFLSSYYPAKRATNIDILETLRNE